MSHIYPSSPPPSSVTIRSVSQSLVSYSQSGRRFARDMGGHRWLVTATYDRLTNDEGREFQAFALAQSGQLQSFQAVFPHLAPRGVATGAPLVNGATVSGRSIPTDGWSPNTVNILRQGDYIKFGHSKIYMITSDANSNLSGQVTLSIEPPLMVALSDNESITVNDVPFTLAFAKNTQEFPAQSPVYYRYEADMEEVY